uniref:Uncharacterized protein n=1 Tax=Lotus japonicus TaxID=34305 RepID=I3T2K2_LOTJA|nr:unknown [Lotus japonicus]
MPDEAFTSNSYDLVCHPSCRNIINNDNDFTTSSYLPPLHIFLNQPTSNHAHLTSPFHNLHH